MMHAWPDCQWEEYGVACGKGGDGDCRGLVLCITHLWAMRALAAVACL